MRSLATQFLHDVMNGTVFPEVIEGSYWEVFPAKVPFCSAFPTLS